MKLSWVIRLRSVFYALVLHIVALALLVFSFSFTKPIKPLHQNISIVNAITVDKAQVDKELQRLKQEEQKKKQEEQQRLAELEKKTAEEKKKAEDLKKQRLEEEKQLLAAKKKKEQEQKQREEEQKKLALLEKEKQELEKQRKIEEEKKKKIEEERRRAEEERKRQEQLAEEKRKQEEEAKRKAEEDRNREEAMRQELAAEQAEADKQLASSIGNEIHEKIARFFNLTGLPKGLSCKLGVSLLPDGEVVGVSIIQSSGNDIFDRRALTAVQKASPLPVPQDSATFERMNFRNTEITFKP